MVNCLVWHPESTTTDEWTSSAANYLAIASDCNIVIFDMSELIKEMQMANIEDCIEEKDSNEERKLHASCKIVATLNGHIDKVVCLAWSPHCSGHLVSGSYDNVAQVFDLKIYILYTNLYSQTNLPHCVCNLLNLNLLKFIKINILNDYYCK